MPDKKVEVVYWGYNSIREIKEVDFYGWHNVMNDCAAAGISEFSIISIELLPIKVN